VMPRREVPLALARRSASGKAGEMSDERAEGPLPEELPAGDRRRWRWVPGKSYRHWHRPTCQQFEELLRGALEGADHLEYRENAGRYCWSLMDRAWYRRTNAADARKLWNKYRYAAAVIPVVAAGAGGSLVGHVHGTPGAVIGWVAIVGGLAGAAINAVRPGVEYGVDLAKAAQFEQLYLDIFSYSMTELRLGSLEEIAPRLEGFAHRMKEIAVMSGGSTATASLSVMRRSPSPIPRDKLRRPLVSWTPRTECRGIAYACSSAADRAQA
jgi:hypothetical protein